MIQLRNYLARVYSYMYMYMYTCWYVYTKDSMWMGAGAVRE